MAKLWEFENQNVTYLNIVAGKLAQKSQEWEVWAIRREYETSDWKKWFKFEKYHKNVTWKITWLVFKDTDYWTQLQVKLDDDIVLTLGTDSNYFSDFAKKLPKVDLSKEVVINPYDFETNDWKKRKWVTVYQWWEKLTNYYYDTEAKENLFNFPTVDRKESSKYDSDDWKMYFIKVKKFLTAEVEKIIPKLEEVKDKEDWNFDFMDEWDTPSIDDIVSWKAEWKTTSKKEVKEDEEELPF